LSRAPVTRERVDDEASTAKQVRRVAPEPGRFDRAEEAAYDGDPAESDGPDALSGRDVGGERADANTRRGDLRDGPPTSPMPPSAAEMITRMTVAITTARL
jgi:hypothetical protein